jgi:ElaA protein
VNVTWSAARLDGLSARDVYDLLALRSAVFVVEQQCAYLDPDGADLHSLHLLGRDEAGSLIAGLRIVDPGIKYVEPSLGRVVSAGHVRRLGLGRALVAEGVRRCLIEWPARGIRISAQAHLERFYAEFGFQGVGEPYLEDDIPHIEMVRPG